MNRARRLASPVALAVAVAVFAVGCHKKVPTPAPAPPPPAATPAPPPPPPPPPPRPAPAPAPLTEEQIFAQKSLDQLNAEKPLDDVYFELDQSTIRDEARSSLQKDADWLKKWGSTQITVEGHCDSRGSSEYNLALGQRRAEVVMRALRAGGVQEDRLEAVSYGKEKPKAEGHDEKSWAQNRRSDMLYR